VVGFPLALAREELRGRWDLFFLWRVRRWFLRETTSVRRARIWASRSRRRHLLDGSVKVASLRL